MTPPDYVPPYMFVALGNYRIFEDRDPFTQQLISISVYGQIAEGRRQIFMDGPPHPPSYAIHTFPGFSTGKYRTLYEHWPAVQRI